VIFTLDKTSEKILKEISKHKELPAPVISKMFDFEISKNLKSLRISEYISITNKIYLDDNNIQRSIYAIEPKGDSYLRTKRNTFITWSISSMLALASVIFGLITLLKG
jgi:hypothetical protein